MISWQSFNGREKGTAMQLNVLKQITFIFLIVSAQQGLAAVSSQEMKSVPAQILAGQGSSIGGMAGKGFTLLDVRRSASIPQKIERLVFDIGDKEGKVLTGPPGFFHAELQKNPQRLVLDFAQMPQVKVDQKGLIEKLKGSMAVRNVSMSVEPVDHALNLTMDLKKNTKVRVYQVPGQKATSKVVVDFMVE